METAGEVCYLLFQVRRRAGTGRGDVFVASFNFVIFLRSKSFQLYHKLLLVSKKWFKMVVTDTQCTMTMVHQSTNCCLLRQAII